MVLLVTIRGSYNGHQQEEDVRVAVESSHTVEDLRQGLRIRGYGIDGLKLCLRQGSRWVELLPEWSVSEANVVSGDLLLLVDEVPDRGSKSDNVFKDLRLLVTAGLDAGRWLDLTQGYHPVGTASTNSLYLSDPKVESTDFGVDVGLSNELLLDPGPERTNRLRVNGAVIERPTTLQLDDIVRVGGTGLTVRAPAGHVERTVDSYGSVPFNRTPQFREPVTDEKFEPLGDIPSEPKPRRFQMLATFAPLLTGIAMATIMGNPRFLLFAVMSPIVGFANRFDAKRTGLADYEKDKEKLDDRIDERREKIERALEAERDVRNRNAPDALQLAQWADTDDKKIWNRARTSDEFLTLRFGDGMVKPAIEIDPEVDGDEDLQEKVADAFTDFDRLRDVPVVVDLGEFPVVALVGEPDETASLTTNLLVQTSVLHSPEDVIIVVATDSELSDSEWVKWLPHVRSKNSPFADTHLATSSVETNRLLREVTSLAERRLLAGDSDFDPRWPWILFVLDQRLEPDPATLSRLLDLCDKAGVSILFVCGDERLVPRQAVVVASVNAADDPLPSSLDFVDPERQSQKFEPGRLPADVALHTARRLAPLRDASAAKAAAGVPAKVTLFDALELDSMDSDWVLEQWSTDRGYSLPAQVGLADNGPVTLDLVKHGPHGLIGGTSGAGKSELVQSLVGNLIAMNSPERVNILFVDYKGGALSGLFEGVPHEVGAVTNLSPLLSLRALTSLRAELDRRMKLFADHDVTDLKSMLEEHPKDAPASLVIVVDEFAALKRELPEFVEGVVSIAERGRSLGIHLLLSTQRPSGAIDENIQQNTNLRLSLRMLDAGESNNVIGTPDAATIPNHLKGRGFARLGPGELIAFQSSWSGAPLRKDEILPPVVIEPFAATDSPLAEPQRPRPPGETHQQPATQLDAQIDMIIEASQRASMKRGRVPWLETLPELMSLQMVLDDPRSAVSMQEPSVITIGMRDDPAAQDQYPEHVDLKDGCLVVMGGSASGKTTTLTTLACSAALRDSKRGGDTLTIFGFDYASRKLGVLNWLPQSLPIADSDNVEAVTRYIAVLERVFNERQTKMAAAIADPQLDEPTFPTVLVLVDGFEMLGEAMSANLQLQNWLDRLMRVCNRGREVGMYSAVTTSSFSGPSARLANTTSNRIVLKQTDENGYRAFGLRSGIAAGLDLAPGQAMTLSGDLLQIAAVCDPPDADGHLVFDIDAVGRMDVTGSVADECKTEPLPDTVSELSGADLEPGRAELGIADLSLEPVVVDVLLDGLTVYGPPRSGKSTVLATVASQLSESDTELWVIGSRSSPLQNMSCWSKAYFGKVPGLKEFLTELQGEIDSYPDHRRVLFFDDAHQFDDMSLNKPFQALVAGDVVCVGSALTVRSLGANPVHKELKSARNLVFLQADDEQGLQAALGGRANIRPGLNLSLGRGLVAVNGVSQTAAMTNFLGSSDLSGGRV